MLLSGFVRDGLASAVAVIVLSPQVYAILLASTSLNVPNFKLSSQT